MKVQPGKDSGRGNVGITLEFGSFFNIFVGSNKSNEFISRVAFNP